MACFNVPVAAINPILPLLFVLSFRCVVHGELESLAFAAQHGTAVPHAAHHQLDAVSQQGHCGRGACA